MTPQYRHRVIANDITRRIETGEIYHKLPSMDKLRAEYTTSWQTMAKVWELLKSRKLIMVVPSVGTFVARKIPAQRTKR